MKVCISLFNWQKWLSEGKKMEERSITQKKYNVWENLFASEKYFKRVFFMVGLMIGKPCGIYDF